MTIKLKDSILEYIETNSFDMLKDKKVEHIKSFAFYNQKLLLVYNHLKQKWELPGGALEKGETFKECISRELKEEANVKLLEYKPLGYLKVTTPNQEPYYQLRAFCKIEPIDKFIKDPDGDITAIKYINHREFNQYISWGEIGEELISKATKLLFQKS